MEKLNPTRQLAAILFTDIVGYTALMGRDSAKALELIRISKEIQKPLVEKHNGKWIKEMGDGAMAQFSTALDAVNCSIDIQESARAKLDAKLRIGIHLGDVTVEENDVHGDGVNVASRLESIADAGGIYISESIEKAIKGQTDVQAKYIGEVNLKNVAYGVRTYALQGVGLPIPEVKAGKEVSGHFTAEMQRRGVPRVGATYLVLSLLIILLVPYASALIDLPTWTETALFIILIIGFPIALYLAWNYERSPHGFVRTSSKASWQNPYKDSQRKPLTSNLIIAGLALIIAVMYVYPRLSNPEDDIETEKSVSVYGKSIAVLPFEDMSPNKDQEYLGDGIAEEILNVLAKIKGLKVIGRTSSFSYKGKGTALPTIGKELGVATILEGSVRKDGNQIRITAQFIDAADGSHIWSLTFNRELKDIFQIQDDLADSITQSLLVSLNITETSSSGVGKSINDEAYNLYLQGKFHLSKSVQIGEDRTKKLYEAIKLFTQSTELDDSFADAYAELASVYTAFGFFYGEREIENTWQLAETFALKALALDATNSQAMAIMGYIKRNRYWDWESARNYYQRSLLASPNNAVAMRDYSLLLFAMNQQDSAKYYAEAALALNPTVDEYKAGVLRAAYYSRNYNAAITISENMGQLRDETDYFLMLTFIQTNKERAVAMILNRFRFGGDSRRELEIVYEEKGWESFLTTIYNFEEEQKVVFGPNSRIYFSVTPKDVIFEILTADAQDRVGLIVYLLIDPIYDPLRSDPRFDELLVKMGLDKYK